MRSKETQRHPGKIISRVFLKPSLAKTLAATIGLTICVPLVFSLVIEAANNGYWLEFFTIGFGGIILTVIAIHAGVYAFRIATIRFKEQPAIILSEGGIGIFRQPVFDGPGWIHWSDIKRIAVENQRINGRQGPMNLMLTLKNPKTFWETHPGKPIVPNRSPIDQIMSQIVSFLPGVRVRGQTSVADLVYSLDNLDKKPREILGMMKKIPKCNNRMTGSEQIEASVIYARV